MEWVLAFLKALPEVLALLRAVQGMAQSAVDRGIGRDQALAEALVRANADLDLANQVRAEAEARHKTGTDADFDPEGARD